MAAHQEQGRRDGREAKGVPEELWMRTRHSRYPDFDEEPALRCSLDMTLTPNSIKGHSNTATPPQRSVHSSRCSK